jgi:hypothetical protein
MLIRIATDSGYMSDVRKAQNMFSIVADAAAEAPVELDFSGVEGATSSWLFAFIGNLAIALKDKYFLNIKFTNLDPIVKEQIDFTIRQALRKK